MQGKHFVWKHPTTKLNQHEPDLYLDSVTLRAACKLLQMFSVEVKYK